MTIPPKAIYRSSTISTKLPMAFAIELEQKILQIVYRNTKVLNSQSNLEEEKQLKESTCLASDYPTKLQESRQYGTGTKIEL